jgi:hypothetical protein
MKAKKIQDNHEKELINSAIKADIIFSNFSSLSGNNAYEQLLYGLDNSERNNIGRLREKWLKRYGHLDHGGWWCSGIDLTTLKDSDWGCFKPDRPKLDQGKPLKYEVPPKVPTGIFALKVEGEALDGFPVPKGKTFWEWVLANPVPVMITEGAKKAASLLSHGKVAIALSGVWNFLDSEGHLKPEIQRLIRPGREFVIAFDQDSRWVVRDNVVRAARKLAEILQAYNCMVTILNWEIENGKGIDDFIVKEGAGEFEKLFEERLEFDDFLEKHAKPRVLEKKGFLKFLQTTMKGRIEMNEMSGRVEIDGKRIEMSAKLCYWFLEEFNIDCYESTIVSGLLYEAEKHKYHPVRRYLDSIAHLTPVNIDNLAVEHFGADDPFYNVLVKKWLIGAVARVYQPGCQFDNALILQGDAYAGKSTWFQTMAGKWFDCSFGSNIESTKQLMVLHDCWIQEWSEFNSVTSKQDFSVLKSFLSRQNDKFVRPYGREPDDNPRSFVMGGSINPEFFLQDETGDRKFWVIPVKRGWKIPIEKIKAERDRIWAAAVQAYRQNPNERYTTPEQHTYHQKINERFRDQDAWFDMITSYLEEKNLKRFSIDRILLDCLEMTKDRIDQKSRNRVRRSLVSMGCIPLNNSRFETEYDNRARRLWEMPETSTSEPTDEPLQRFTTVENNGYNGSTTEYKCTPLYSENQSQKEIQKSYNGYNGNGNLTKVENNGNGNRAKVENNGNGNLTTVENNGYNGSTTEYKRTPLYSENQSQKEIQTPYNGYNGKNQKKSDGVPDGDSEGETYEQGLVKEIVIACDRLGWNSDRLSEFIFLKFGKTKLDLLNRSDLMDLTCMLLDWKDNRS